MAKSLPILAGLFLILITGAAAREEISGPVAAELIRVIDGDTLLVEAEPWPQQKIEVYVRIRGIDAPELRSKCMAIRHAGRDARQALEALTSDSRKIHLTRIVGDKYFGRIVADVTLPDGVNAADHLLLAGLVASYDGGRKPREACNLN